MEALFLRYRPVRMADQISQFETGILQILQRDIQLRFTFMAELLSLS